MTLFSKDYKRKNVQVGNQKINMILPVVIVFSIFGVVCLGEVQPLSSKCDDCYLKHYSVKGCTPVHESGSDCPVRYNCPKSTYDPSVCLFKGKIYKAGEEVDTGDECYECMCRSGRGKIGALLHCSSAECFGDRRFPKNHTCYFSYKEGKCCGTKKCLPNADAQKIVCEYGGKTYHYGDEIEPTNTQTCKCTEEWSGVNDNSCTTHHCNWLDKYIKYLIDGCIPIYYQDICCPSEMLCDVSEFGETNITTVSLAQKEDIDSGNTCIFKDTHYKIGQNLNLHRYTNCVTCTCLTPPDFTCVQRKCPEPPKGNCEATYTRGECCPSYACVL